MILLQGCIALLIAVMLLGLSLIYRYIYGRCSDELYYLAPLLKTFSKVTGQVCQTKNLYVKVPACNVLLTFGTLILFPISV